MATFIGPSITTNGLILDLDAANIKSTTGEQTTNLATSPKDVTVGSTTIPTRTNNQVVNYDGTLTGGLLSGAGWLARILSLSTGRYTSSWIVKAGTNTTCDFSWGGSHAGNSTTFTFNLLTGVFTNITQASGEIYGAESLGNGWWRVYYSSSISSTSLYIPQLNNGVGTMYLGFVQIEQKRYTTALVDGTRSNSFFDISGNSYTSSLTDGPIYNAVNSGARRNLFTIDTENFAPLYKYAISVTTNTTVSPFGNQVADKLYANTATDSHYIAPGYNVIANTIYTYSVYVKALEYTKVHFAEGYNGAFNCSVDLTNGNIISSGGTGFISAFVETSIDGWYRVCITFKPWENYAASLGFAGYPNSGATTGAYGVSYTGDGSSGVAIFGIQLEVGPFATAYQKVSSATVFDDTNKSASFIFDGLNDMLRIPSPSDRFAWTPSGAGNNYLSIELWVKTLDGDHIISKPWNGGGQYNYQLYGWGGFYIFSGDASNFGLNGSALNTGNWEYFCGIITPTQLAVYRNGVLNVGFTNHGLVTNGPVLNTNNDLCLMAVFNYGIPWVGNIGLSTSGNIGSVRIYNRVLSAAEVLRNYNALRGRFGV